MTAEVNSVLAQLAALQREIISPDTGQPILAFDNVPYVINTADMPLFINYSGALSSNTLKGSDDLAREFDETRQYIMTLYHSPYAAGVEGEKLAALSGYFSLVLAKFGGHPHLKNLGGIMNALIVSDSGVTSMMQFMGQAYFGIRFILQVTGRTRRPLLVGD